MDGMAVPTVPLAAIASHAARVDRDAAFPFESLAALRDAGLLGLTVPVEFGGGGAGLERSVALVRSVGAACASTALVLAMQLVHARSVAENAAWPPHLRALVAEAAADGALINALRVEPALGTPARGGLPDTVARRTAAGWSLTGRKIYSTGSPGLAWGLVFARTDEPVPRTGMVLVPMDSPGVRIEPSWDQLGLRGSGSHDVVFDGVAVPTDHAVDLRPPGDWAKPDAVNAAWSGLIVAALYTGVAEAARDWLLQFLHDRTPANLGASLATLPRMQEAVGAIEAKLLTARRLVDAAAAETDRGRPPSPGESGLLKTIACEAAIAAVQDAMALAGNHALARSNPIERHLRDVLCARIHTPQPDAALAAAGRAALAAAKQQEPAP